MRRFALLVALLLSSCTSYRELLDRGQRLYQENEFDRALANWRALEPDAETLGWADQARYAYLRGMTDLRLGFDADARHWLAIAKALDQLHPGALKDAWKTETEAELAALNRKVYGLPAAAPAATAEPAPSASP
jgi:hypothetical protein